MTPVRYLSQPRHLLLVVIGALLLVVAGVIYGRDTEPPGRMAHSQGSSASAPEPEQLWAFSILRAPPQAMPALTRAAISRSLRSAPLPEVNLDLAHRVATSFGIDVWVLPGDGVVCVARDLTGTIGCNSTSEVIKRGMSLIERQPPQPGRRGDRYLLLGIASDAVKKVRVRPDGGRPRTVPVAQNVYAYLGASPASAELIRP